MDTKKIMVEYLKLKVEQEDWHGVRDAAAELETLAKLHSLFPSNMPTNKVDPKSGS
jgi:hypothetical protein